MSRGMNEIGNSRRQEYGRYLNIRAENSQLPFRRRERAMSRFRRMRSLQKFALIHPSVYNHLNHQKRSLAGRGSNRYVTLFFLNGLSLLLPEARSSAKNGDGLELVSQHIAKAEVGHSRKFEAAQMSSYPLPNQLQ